MWLITPVWRGPTRALWNLTGFELAGRRWWVGISQAAAGGPIIDGARFSLASDDNPQLDRRDYYGVSIRLPRTAGPGLGIGGRRNTINQPGWLLRHMPRRLFTPRFTTGWWPPKPQRERWVGERWTLEPKPEWLVLDDLEAKWEEVRQRLERPRPIVTGQPFKQGGIVMPDAGRPRPIVLEPPDRIIPQPPSKGSPDAD